MAAQIDTVEVSGLATAEAEIPLAAQMDTVEVPGQALALEAEDDCAPGRARGMFCFLLLPRRTWDRRWPSRPRTF
jgi:hypothetical protein